MRKPRSFAEIYNDLDGEIVNVFRVLQNPMLAGCLQNLLELTPYAREEFDLSYKKSDDVVEQARRTIIRAFMGFSSDYATRHNKVGFRTTNFKSGRHASGDWVNYPAKIEVFIERLKGIVIENRDALELMPLCDTPKTLFYIDPPYQNGTREKNCVGRAYKHEMDDDAHRKLIDLLKSLQGMVIVSGFMCDLYAQGLEGWQMVQKSAVGQAGNGRGSKYNTECLWLSPNIQSRRMF
jgi:DNA adenine methylase